MSATHTDSKPCSCHQCQPPPACDCCGIPCPERPRYFCGHLLSDADLSLEQKYQREKQKLYHRTLHGTGVVCGLLLTCHPSCDGSIRISSGFGIDDCGNDLIVCKPYDFNVIEALDGMDFPGPAPVKDECGNEEQSGCDVHHCFQVAICYREEPHDPVVPFPLGCTPRPGLCEPSRIIETIGVTLLPSPLQNKTWIGRLIDRLLEAVELVREGPFAEAMNGGAALGTNSGRLSQLRQLFEWHLMKYPDEQQCSLRESLCEDESADRTAYDRFLDVVWNYIAGRVLAALTPECEAPCKPGCVVIGSVQVNLTRRTLEKVCNSPRQFVPAMLSHLPGWLLDLLTGALSTGGRKGESGCCAQTAWLASLLRRMFVPRNTKINPRPGRSGLVTMFDDMIDVLRDVDSLSQGRSMSMQRQSDWFNTLRRSAIFATTETQTQHPPPVPTPVPDPVKEPVNTGTAAIVAMLRGQVEGLKSEKAELTKILANAEALGGNNPAAPGDVEKLKSRIAELDKEITAKEAELSRFERDSRHAVMTERINLKEAERNDLLQQANDALEKLQEGEKAADLDDLASKIAALNSDIEKLKKEFAATSPEKEGEPAPVEEDLTAAMGRAKLFAEWKAKEDEQAAVVKMLAAAEAVPAVDAETAKKVAALKARMEELQKEAEAKKEELDKFDLSRRKTVLAQKIKLTKTERDRLVKEARDALTKLQKGETVEKTEDLAPKIAGLNGQLEAMQKELEELPAS